MIEKITGKLQVGHRMGRKIGFPTVNIPYNGDLRGVFAGKCFVEGQEYAAAISVGGRPTFNDEEILCEAYLLDFSETLSVNTELEMHIYLPIREVMKFNSVNELIEQLRSDVQFVKSWYTGRKSR